MATPDGKTKLIVDIPVTLKTQFKVHCATNGVAMTELIESLIRDYLNQNEEKGAS
jgi:hypothetical protein